MGVPSRLGKVGVLGSATSTQNYADFEMDGGTLQTLAFGVALCLSAHLNGYMDLQRQTVHWHKVNSQGTS